MAADVTRYFSKTAMDRAREYTEASIDTQERFLAALDWLCEALGEHMDSISNASAHRDEVSLLVSGGERTAKAVADAVRRMAGQKAMRRSVDVVLNDSPRTVYTIALNPKSFDRFTTVTVTCYDTPATCTVSYEEKMVRVAKVACS